MTGHAEILMARIHGQTPPQVWVHVLDTPPDYWMAQDATDSIANGFRAQIIILPTESVSGLDLAILKGLTVHVIGENESRCMAVMNRCKNVQVHKFVCVGTLEERIDQMIEQKKQLAESIVGAGEAWLTELSTDQLRDLFTLGHEAVGD